MLVYDVKISFDKTIFYSREISNVYIVVPHRASASSLPTGRTAPQQRAVRVWG